MDGFFTLTLGPPLISLTFTGEQIFNTLLHCPSPHTRVVNGFWEKFKNFNTHIFKHINETLYFKQPNKQTQFESKISEPRHKSDL